MKEQRLGNRDRHSAGTEARRKWSIIMEALKLSMERVPAKKKPATTAEQEEKEYVVNSCASR